MIVGVSSLNLVLNQQGSPSDLTLNIGDIAFAEDGESGERTFVFASTNGGSLTGLKIGHIDESSLDDYNSFMGGLDTGSLDVLFSMEEPEPESESNSNSNFTTIIIISVVIVLAVVICIIFFI